ncbi:MAG: sigma-70 family RNA polymerase sigma factor [Cyclobacteriaceae bacterium]|nr:sigma-70 family RNA polymerase sigma factor [Cyclobacteriaceae bacterium]
MNAQNISTLGELKHHFKQYYHELSQIAHRKLRFERIDHTLDTVALVHEAYGRLYQQANSHFRNSSHFLAIAAVSMRRILINYARDKKRQKRGGDLIRMSYGKANIPVQTTPEDILALHDALNKLKRLNKRQARVVEFHFFGGFKHHEIAEHLSVSEETIRRDWRLARAWLSIEMKKQL